MTDLVGVLVGEYFLLECLAREGMVETYRARPTTRGGYDVLLRLFRPPFPDATQFREHFAAEVEKVWHCHHASLLPLIEFGTGDDWLYCVTVFPEMETLEQWVERRQALWGVLPQHRYMIQDVHTHHLSLEVITAICIQLCEAVAHLHRHDIVHGNIQPTSVYVQTSEQTGEQDEQRVRVFLTNLSMQHAYQEHEPLTLLAEEGNPAYIAPEQSIGMLSPACDVYALGVLLYRLLTGETPDGLSEQLAERNWGHENVVTHALREARPELPESLAQVLQEALANTPGTRIARVEDLAYKWMMALEKTDVANSDETIQLAKVSLAPRHMPDDTTPTKMEREHPRSRVPIRARKMTWAWKRISARP